MLNEKIINKMAGDFLVVSHTTNRIRIIKYRNEPLKKIDRFFIPGRLLTKKESSDLYNKNKKVRDLLGKEGGKDEKKTEKN